MNMVYYALFNPHSCTDTGEQAAHRLENLMKETEVKYVDITTVSYPEFFSGLCADDVVIICGGDGTLNHFINDTKDIPYENEIQLFACGTGNDFLRDIGGEPGGKPVRIDQYLKDLPTVTVNGKEYLFLNNVGFGIDGYCTQVGDEMRAQHKEKINYAGIAIKGMLGGFKPVNSTITVDGVEKSYKKTWLAPTMKGRFYGGGMMPAPEQDRLDPEHKVSVQVFFGKGKIRTLMVFPSIFKGEHVKHTEMVEVIKGSDVKVVFDTPCALQIDGETIVGVTEYEVRTR